MFFACAITLIGALTLAAQSGTTAEGLKYTVLQAGNGPAQKMGQEVLIQVEGLDSTGKVEFSSRLPKGFSDESEVHSQ